MMDIEKLPQPEKQTAEIKRTIETILNLETGEIIEASYIFREPKKREDEIFRFRRLMQEQFELGTSVYVCLYCKQPIGIRAHPIKKDYILTHTFRSNDCLIKTTNRLTEEQVRCIKYNGVKESEQHLDLKTRIAAHLVQDPDVRQVAVEQVFRDKAISMDWKKPDILADFNGMCLAFELQLSTTFLSVIVSRSLFYQQRNVFLLWIFPHFSVNSDVQRFTQKDVYYNQSFNVFVFDQEAQERSALAQQLVLKCFFKQFKIIGENLQETWLFEFITLRELKFNKEKSEVLYYDSLTEKKKLQSLLDQERKNEISKLDQVYADSKAKRAVIFLREYYKKDWPPFNSNDVDPIEDIHTDLELQTFNDQLGFKKEKANFVAALFLEASKQRFLKFLLEQSKIQLDLPALRIDNRSILSYLCYDAPAYQFYQLMPVAYIKGYYFSDADFKLFESLYEKNYFNETESEREAIERWAYLYCLQRLLDPKDALIVSKIRKILFAILSLKFKLSVGQRFKNLKELSMNIFTHAPEQGHIYLRAMKRYDEYAQQLADDKSGKLRKKIEQNIVYTGGQDNISCRIIFEIFPELA